MKLRVRSLLALTLMSLALVVLVPPASPAWACSCAPEDQDARADLIVAGTVTEVSDTAIRLAVDSVEKGAATADTVRLTVNRDEASCGYGFRAGKRYRVNSIAGATGLCVGVSPLPALPLPSTAPLAAPGGSAPDSDASDGSSGGWWPAAGVATTVTAIAIAIAIAIALAVVAGVAIALRRRRRAD